MPVPTVAEVLKQTDPKKFTDEYIASLDANILSALTGYVSNIYQTAEQKEQAATAAAAKAESDRKSQEALVAEAKSAQEAAELADRNVKDFWATTYPTSLTEHNAALQAAETARINAEAKAAWLQAQVDGAKAAGITLADAPAFTPPARPAPVVNPNTTPGTPTFVNPDEVMKRLDKGVHTIQDIGWKYQQLYGTPIPISPSELVAQADALKLNPMEYASRTFKFAEKEEERRLATAKAHDDAIRAEIAAQKEAEHKKEVEKLQAEWNAEKRKLAETGANSNHPDLKAPPGSAKFADLQRATKAGERPDPLKLTPQERRKTTLDNIHKALEEREAVPA
jgi:hypothetical protein